jgi:hypothetical protein
LKLTELFAATLPSGCDRARAGSADPLRVTRPGVDEWVEDEWVEAEATPAAMNDTASPIDPVRANNRAAFMI